MMHDTITEEPDIVVVHRSHTGWEGLSLYILFRGSLSLGAGCWTIELHSRKTDHRINVYR